MSIHVMMGLIMLASCASGLQTSDPARGVQGERRGSVSANPKQRTSEWIFRNLCECYELTQAQKDWLQAELKRRVEVADAYEQESQQLLMHRAKGISSAELRALASERTQNKPLNLENVRKALEPRLSAEQRRRGDPLITARLKSSADGTKRAVEERTGRTSGPLGTEKPMVPAKPTSAKVAMPGKSAKVATPSAQPSAEPGPAKEDSKKSARRNGKANPQRPAKDSAPRTGARATESKGRPADGAREASAKLSDWQKTLGEYAARYRFTDAQMAGAQAILKDCERRYEDYRKAHAADYSRVEKIADSKQRAAELATLDAPLAALGHEFTQRLEQIPTADQRAAATSAKPSKSR